MGTKTMAKRRPSSTPALELLAGTGERVTPTRRAVLEVLLAADRALSHHELEQALRERSRHCDRVTLYRVLEWLVSRGLAHKIASEDRVWRFKAARNEEHRHAHFQCTRCREVFCLEDLQPVFILTLPPGFSYEHAELKVQGVCSDCKP